MVMTVSRQNEDWSALGRKPLAREMKLTYCRHRDVNLSPFGPSHQQARRSDMSEVGSNSKMLSSFERNFDARYTFPFVSDPPKERRLERGSMDMDQYSPPSSGSRCKKLTLSGRRQIRYQSDFKFDPVSASPPPKSRTGRFSGEVAAEKSAGPAQGDVAMMRVNELVEAISALQRSDLGVWIREELVASRQEAEILRFYGYGGPTGPPHLHAAP